MKHQFAAWAAALALVISGEAKASTFTNGSFEDAANFLPDGNNDTSLSTGSTAMPGWTVLGSPSHNVSWIKNSNPFGLSASDGSYFLDLTDYANGAPFGGVAQSITTIAGGVYRLSFDLGSSLSGGIPSAIEAKAGSADQIFTSTNTTGSNIWETESFFFSAASTSTTISLRGNVGNAYIGLDNVSISLDHVSAVPIPAALPLFGSAVGGLGLFGRWRKRRAAAAA